VYYAFGQIQTQRFFSFLIPFYDRFAFLVVWFPPFPYPCLRLSSLSRIVIAFGFFVILFGFYLAIVITIDLSASLFSRWRTNCFWVQIFFLARYPPHTSLIKKRRTVAISFVNNLFYYFSSIFQLLFLSSRLH